MEDKRLKLKKTEKEQVVAAIKGYFLEERDEEIGELAAVLLVDFLGKEMGPIYYNKGIQDSKSYFEDRVEDLHSLEIQSRR